MKIVILGWGSLLWDTQDDKQIYLKTVGDWNSNELKFPLEFSRISRSRSRALTLVIDPENGEKCSTFYKLSSRTYLEDAICDLRVREGTVNRRIGFVNLIDGTERSNVIPELGNDIRKWASQMKFDAVIWTDLPSNFKDETEKIFSVDNAIEYLTSKLDEENNLEGYNMAHEYFSKAPVNINTPLRKILENHPWYIKNN